VSFVPSKAHELGDCNVEQRRRFSGQLQSISVSHPEDIVRTILIVDQPRARAIWIIAARSVYRKIWSSLMPRIARNPWGGL